MNRFPVGLLKHFNTCEIDDCTTCYEIRRSDWYRKYMGLPLLQKSQREPQA